MEMEYCRGNPEYFVETYVKIESKDTEELVQPFKLWPKQRDALRSIHEQKLNIVLKARQLGITWLALAYAAYLGLLWEGRLVIFLSKTEDGAKELVSRLSFIFAHMPLVQKEGSAPYGWNGPMWDASALELKVKFPDGMVSKFQAFPSSPSAARGRTADLLVLDEWAFQQFAEDIWKSVFPTINRTSGGKVIGVSTIERGTLFEKLYTEEDNGFNKIFLPWDTDPSRTPEWYAKSLKTLGEAQMFQEYPSSVEEALTIPGGAFFPEVKPQTHVIASKEFDYVRRYVSIDYGLDMLSAHWIAVDTKNTAWVYREFDKPDMNIAEAARVILKLSEGEEIGLYLAPPDLWNRSQESGKSRAQLFNEAGLNLTKSSNDFASGCAAMKEWLRVDDTTKKPRLQFLDAPNLVECLRKIQRDPKRPDVYETKRAHELTHDVDSLRYFCIWWVQPARGKKKKMRDVPPDIREDWKHASPEIREIMRKRYGFE